MHGAFFCRISARRQRHHHLQLDWTKGFDGRNILTRKENWFSFINNELMIKDKAVITLIRQEVDRLNKSLGDYERVQRFELLASDWSAGKGEITSTMKIRRDVIQRHYKAQIEKLFQ